jgi:hypothetical protein
LGQLHAQLRQVWECHEEDMPPLTIARHLGLGLDQVRYCLDKVKAYLRRKLFSWGPCG